MYIIVFQQIKVTVLGVYFKNTVSATGVADHTYYSIFQEFVYLTSELLHNSEALVYLELLAGGT